MDKNHFRKESASHKPFQGKSRLHHRKLAKSMMMPALHLSIGTFLIFSCNFCCALPFSRSPRTLVCIDVIGCSCTSQHRDKNRLKAKFRMHTTYAKTRSTKTLSVNSLKMHLSQGPKIDQPLFLITLAISFPAH